MKNVDRKKLLARFPAMPSTASRRMCGDKKCYDTERKAAIFALTMSVKYGHEQRAYECPLCSKFHLTTTKKEAAK